MRLSHFTEVVVDHQRDAQEEDPRFGEMIIAAYMGSKALGGKDVGEPRTHLHRIRGVGHNPKRSRPEAQGNLQGEGRADFFKDRLIEVLDEVEPLDACPSLYGGTKEGVVGEQVPVIREGIFTDVVAVRIVDGPTHIEEGEDRWPHFDGGEALWAAVEFVEEAVCDGQVVC